MHLVTINTDAGFYPRDKVGSYAYWIKSHSLFLRGSGMFKESVHGPAHAELQAIINAVYVLDKSGFTSISKIVFNRDNIHAHAYKDGNPLQQRLWHDLHALKKKCKSNVSSFYEFRHVRAHSEIDSSRKFVNDWCDKECTRQLRDWNAKRKLLWKQENTK